MSNTRVGAIQVVKAKKDGRTDFWAAAIARPQAEAAVQRELGPTWSVKLSSRHLSQEEVAVLNLRPNDVRKLHA